MGDRIRVLVVDHHRMFADGLRLLLGGQPDIELVGAYNAVEEALEGDPAADVVLLGLDDPDEAADRALQRLREAWPQARVVGLMESADDVAVAQVLAAGARGFLPRSQPVEDLPASIRLAAAGEVVLPASDLTRVVESLRGGEGAAADGAALARLTRREAEILRALAGGATAQEVAGELGISRLTVESHVKSILAKLGVHSKIEAVTLAWRHGLAPISRTA